MLSSNYANKIPCIIYAKWIKSVLYFIELSANMDAFDVRLADYNRELTELHSRIDTVTAEVHKQIEYYSTCDI